MFEDAYSSEVRGPSEVKQSKQTSVQTKALAILAVALQILY